VSSVPSRTRPPRVAPRSVAGPLRTQAKAGRRITVLTQGPYFDVKTRSCPCYKGCRRSSSRTHAVGPASARHRGAASLGQLRRRSTLLEQPVPPFALPRPGARRSKGSQRLAPAVAAVGHLRCRPDPNSGHKPVAGEPSASPTSSPAKPVAGAAQFWPEPPPPWPKDPIASPLSFQGLIREPGAYL
jgi:hypothetical protein